MITFLVGVVVGAFVGIAMVALLFLVVVGAVCAWRLFREYKK